MKPGNLVQHCFSERIGIILKQVWNPICGVTSSNKVFDVLWRDGTIGHDVWNHDLELISENR